MIAKKKPNRDICGKNTKFETSVAAGSYAAGGRNARSICPRQSMRRHARTGDKWSGSPQKQAAWRIKRAEQTIGCPKEPPINWKRVTITARAFWLAPGIARAARGKLNARGR